MKKLSQLAMGVTSVLTGLDALSKVFRGSGLGEAPVPSAPKTSMKMLGGREYKLSHGQALTLGDRIRRIQKMIRKGRRSGKIIALAKKIVTARCGDEWCIPEKAYQQEVEAIFHAVRKRVRYTGDPHGIDLYQHPERTLEFAGGDCDDYCIILCSLLLAIGYPVRLRVIQTQGQASWSHIYVMVGLPPRKPTEWMSLDASLDRPPGWECPPELIVRKKDFPAV